MFTYFSIPLFLFLPPFSFSLPPSSQFTTLTIKFKSSLPGASSKMGTGRTKVAEAVPWEKMTEGKISGGIKDKQCCRDTGISKHEFAGQRITGRVDHLQFACKGIALCCPLSPLLLYFHPLSLPPLWPHCHSQFKLQPCVLHDIASILESQPIPSLAPFTLEGPSASFRREMSDLSPRKRGGKKPSKLQHLENVLWVLYMHGYTQSIQDTDTNL